MHVALPSRDWRAAQLVRALAVPQFGWLLQLSLLASFAALCPGQSGSDQDLPPLDAAAASLREQFLQAVRAQASDQQLQALLSGRSIAEVFDAIAPISMRIGVASESCLRRLLVARATEVRSVWQNEVGKRRARAAAFALSDLNWAAMHAAADSSERADIEAVAEWMRPDEPTLRQLSVSVPDSVPTTRQQPRGADAERSVVRLRQLAIAGERARGERWREALLGAEWSEDLKALLMVANTPCTGFAIVDGMQSKDRSLRARTAMAIRLQLRLSLTPGLADALSAETIAPLRRLVGQLSPLHAGLQEHELPGVLARLSAQVASLPWSQLADGASLSQRSRERLARALTTDLAAAPVDAGSVRSSLGLSLQQQAEALGASVARVAAAASLGAAEYLMVLHQYAKTEAAGLPVLLAGLLLAYSPQFDVAAPAGSLVAGLLDDQNPLIAELATLFADRILQDDEVAALAQKVGDLALQLLTSDAGGLVVRQGEVPMPGLPFGLATPGNRAAQLLATAVRAHDVRLFDPVWERLAGLDSVANKGTEGVFLVGCAAVLAGSLDRARAAQAHSWVVAMLAAGPEPGRAGSGKDLLGHALLAMYQRLYGVVPETRLSSYEADLEHADQRREFAQHEDLFEAMPQARARHVWPLRYGEGIAAALAGDKQQQGEAWYALVKEWQHRRPRLLAMVRAGQLPRELVAATVPYQDAPTLTELAAVLPETEELDEHWSVNMANAVKTAPNSTFAADLAALRRLAACTRPWLGLAVARRAASMGEQGRAIAATAIAAGTTASDMETVGAFAALAIELGIAPADPVAVLARLRAVKSRRQFADAFAVRFAGLAWRSVPSGDLEAVVQMAQCDVDIEILRSICSARGEAALMVAMGPARMRECTAATAAAVMQLAGELPRWSSRFEAVVLQQTLHADASVRLAAYRALRTRDPELWLSAWLPYEAGFDSDPAVRAFGESLRR